MERKMIRPWCILLILAVLIVVVGLFFWIAVFGDLAIAVPTYIAFIAIVTAILLTAGGLNRLDVKKPEDRKEVEG